MTVARAAALGALAVIVLVLAVVLLGDGGKRTYYMTFQNAGQLVNGNDVQVGGRRIGSIEDIELTQDNQARVKITVQEPYAPLHDGTTGIIRLTSLSGVANRYIALTPGPDSNPELDDGAVLTTDSTTTVVDLDQLFNTLDAPTRRDLSRVIKGFSQQYDGKAPEVNRSAKYFAPFLSTSRVLLDEVAGDEATLTRFLLSTARASTTLADRAGDLSGAVRNTAATANAIAREDPALDQSLALLPATLRKANTTFVNLRATLDDLDVLVEESKPATKDLAVFLRRLRPLVDDSEPTIRDLSLAIDRSGPDNDLTDANRLAPRLARQASAAFPNSRRALIDLQPVLENLRPYTPDLVGWFRDFGQSPSAYDANGHYARIAPSFNAYGYTPSASGGTLTPVAPGDRLNGLEHDVIKRCPGAATQAPADGSAPFTDGGALLDGGTCDPALVPPGP